MRVIFLFLFFVLSLSAENFELRARNDRAPIFTKAEDATRSIRKQTVLDAPLKELAFIGDEKVQKVLYLSEINGVYKLSFYDSERETTNIAYVHHSLVQKVRIGRPKAVFTQANSDQVPVFFEKELLKTYREQFSLKTVTEIKYFFAEVPEKIKEFEKTIVSKDELIEEKGKNIVAQEVALEAATKKYTVLNREKNRLDKKLESRQLKNINLRTKNKTLAKEITEHLSEIKSLNDDKDSLKRKALRDAAEAESLLHTSLAVSGVVLFLIGFVIAKVLSTKKINQLRMQVKEQAKLAKVAESHDTAKSLLSTRSGIRLQGNKK